MTTLLPTSQSTGVEAYEDMFKEITRKLYGDESAHGLYPHNTQVAQLAPGTPSAPEGERSFTTLVSDRSLAQIDYENAANEVNNAFKAEDHLTTAFGLAALMQNGFPPPGAILNPVSFPITTNTKQQTSVVSAITSASDERWQTTDDLISWQTNKINSYVTTPQKFFKVKPKIEPTDTSTISNTSTIANNSIISSNLQQQPPQQHLMQQNQGQNQQQQVQQQTTLITTADIKPTITQNVPNPTNTVQLQKRYSCQTCPYSTDRRDLFTRHENIHKDEKPFHCYACLKQFNRADHVKKHFLRMHRDMTYEINKTRRMPVGSKSYYINNQVKIKFKNPLVFLCLD
jgi:hypothetical protein